jgi:predicted dehydrogenase
LFINRAYGMKGEKTGVLTAQGASEELRFAADDQFGTELTYFSRCVLEGREPQPSGAEGLADLRVETAVRRSLLSEGGARGRPPAAAAAEPSQMVKLPPTPEPELIKVRAPTKPAEGMSLAVIAI